MDGLRALGIPARLSELERGVTARDPRFKGAACFSAPSWYEIEACGKKITGSAQFRKDGVILQHGSIPLSMDYSKLARCFKTRSPAHAKRLESMLPGKAAGLTEVCGRQVSACELQQELVRAFENAFDWKLEKAPDYRGNQGGGQIIPRQVRRCSLDHGTGNRSLTGTAGCNNPG